MPIRSVPVTDTYIEIDDDLWKGVQFLKFRSGTGGTPVNQLGARTLRVWLRNNFAFGPHR